MMYFSCDVGKFLNSERGLLDVKNYDYEITDGHHLRDGQEATYPDFLQWLFPRHDLDGR